MLPLKKGALKCPSCGTFQDWRRFLTIGNASLGLVLAVISVTALALPAILELADPDAEVAVLRALPTNAGYEMLLVNKGRADAFLYRTEVFADNALMIRQSVNFEAVPRNSHLRHPVLLDPAQRDTLRSYDSCELRLAIVDLGGVESELVLRVACKN